MSHVIMAAAAALVLTLAGCGSPESTSAADVPRSTRSTPSAPESAAQPSSPSPRTSPGTSPGTSPATSPANGQGAVIVTGRSDYGTMLFDESGQAIYLFDRETTSTPECYGECAEAWPPVLTKGPPRARGEVRSGLLDTTERKDGSLQVTYDGHPLYFYAHEGKNEVLCHDVSEFGGVWLVVTPGGDPAPAS